MTRTEWSALPLDDWKPTYETLHLMSEFVVPYEAVRTSSDPEAGLRAFLESTYNAAADLANWERAKLER